MNPDNASLQSYIDEQRRNGIADETIYQSLVATGWPEATVQQLLRSELQPLNPIATQPASSPQSLNATMSSQKGFLAGRIGRLGFLTAQVYSFIYCIFILLFLFLMTFVHLSSLLPIINILEYLMGTVIILAALPIMISIHVRRWHDLDQSGWLTLIVLIPFAGLIAEIVLLFAPGTSGPNKFGYTHPKSFSPRDIFGLTK